MSFQPYDYYAGETIALVEDPIFKSLDMELWGLRCNTCWTNGHQLQFCQICELVSYCSEACRLEDCCHFLECQSICFRDCLQGWAAKDMVLLFHLYALFKENSKSKRSFNMYDGSVRTINDLMTNEQRWRQDNYVQHLCADLSRRLRKEDREVNSEYLVRLYGLLMTNAIDEFSEQGAHLGKILFVQTTIFNHSCKPTASIVAVGESRRIVALVEIPRGEAPTLSYLSANQHTDFGERQNFLYCRYNFKCQCPRCSLESIQRFDYQGLLESVKEMNEIMIGYLHFQWPEILKKHYNLLLQLKLLYHEYDPRVTAYLQEFAIFVDRFVDDDISVRMHCDVSLHHTAVTYNVSLNFCALHA